MRDAQHDILFDDERFVFGLFFGIALLSALKKLYKPIDIIHLNYFLLL